MREITIVGLKKILVTWIIYPIVPSIFTTSNKSVSTHHVNGLNIFSSSLLRFFQNQHLYIYPQKLKKKGYDYEKDQTTQA